MIIEPDASRRCRVTLDHEGSTLIGLVAGIIVLAILATVVVAVLNTTTKSSSVVGTTKAASVAACNQTVESVQSALEAYKAQTPTGRYPTTLGALTTQASDTPTNPTGPWLKQVPSAQLDKNGYAITYAAATGTINVKTKTSTLPGTTATACKGA